MEDVLYLHLENEVCVPLYKYYNNLDYAKDAINNHRIHFEKPESYNDIYDSAYYNKKSELLSIKYSGEKMTNLLWLCLDDNDVSSEEFKNKILIPFEKTDEISIGDTIDYISKSFPNIISDTLIKSIRVMIGLDGIKQHSDYLISCFSENKDSILMWSYYADSHKGVCLEFDFGNEVWAKKCNKVQYSNHFNVNSKNNHYFIKSSQWQHEQEWRIVKRGSEYEQMDNIVSIYLGSRMAYEERQEFIKLAIQNKLDLYLVVPNTKEYKLEFRKLIEQGKLLSHCDVIFKGVIK